MKKIIILGLFSILTLNSCSHELETFNESPNSPTEVTPALLLTGVEVSTFAVHTTGLTRLSGIFSQQLCGTSTGQLGAYSTYDVNEDDINNEWNAIYTNSGINADQLIKQYGDESPYYAGIAKVLLALNASYATDFWNDVPLSDAFGGLDSNFSPMYDSQEQVYQQIQTLLSEAIVHLDAPAASNKNLPAADDMIYGGDVTKWKKAAYTLKARFALRLSERTGSTVAANEALSYLSSAIDSNDDNMNAVFSGTGNAINQWYAFETNRANYLKMGDYFVEMLKSLGDPRLPFYAAEDDNGGYTGTSFNDVNNIASSSIGAFLATPDKEVAMVTYSEAKFLEAEAKFRLGDPTALVAFQEGVRASLINVTGTTNEPYILSVTSTLSLSNIMSQKYVAMFGTSEPYNDHRRTGFPVLVPASGSAVAKRLPTSQQERLYNTNATVVSNLTDPVWWDAN